MHWRLNCNVAIVLRGYWEQQGGGRILGTAGRWENMGNSRAVGEYGEVRCEVGRWMELAQDRVQWQALVLAVMNHLVLLPES